MPACRAFWQAPTCAAPDVDATGLYNLLENEVLPLYYDYPDRWVEIIKNGMKDIVPQFDSNRMATEYYEKLYH